MKHKLSSPALAGKLDVAIGCGHVRMLTSTVRLAGKERIEARAITPTPAGEGPTPSILAMRKPYAQPLMPNT